MVEDNGNVIEDNITHEYQFGVSYYFNVGLAQMYGVEEAIMLQNIIHWIRINKANGVNLHDDRYWTYNSVRAFGELFPFWSGKQVRRILQSLVDQKVIVTGNYNKSAYDRTLWYSLSDMNMINGLPNQKIDLPESTNGLSEKGEPIPDINTDINTDAKEAEKNFCLNSNLYRVFVATTLSIGIKDVDKLMFSPKQIKSFRWICNEIGNDELKKILQCIKGDAWFKDKIFAPNFILNQIEILRAKAKTIKAKEPEYERIG